MLQGVEHICSVYDEVMMVLLLQLLLLTILMPLNLEDATVFSMLAICLRFVSRPLRHLRLAVILRDIFDCQNSLPMWAVHDRKYKAEKSYTKKLKNITSHVFALTVHVVAAPYGFAHVVICHF